MQPRAQQHAAQALQLMNDVQHFEAARKLAERMLVEGGKTPAERIRFGYRVVLSREPDADEADIVGKALSQFSFATRTIRRRQPRQCEWANRLRREVGAGVGSVCADCEFDFEFG